MFNRSPPSPIPEVALIPEYAATGRTEVLYSQIREALEVPWVGVLMLAYARFPTFFDCLCRAVLPAARTAAFVDAAAGLRATVESEVDTWPVASLLPELKALGYRPRELDQIRNLIEVFSYGNFPYFLIATAARLLIEGERFGVAEAGTPAFATGAPPLTAPFVMIEAHHADDSLGALYEDLKRVVGLPFVNSDYRALARWPSYFAIAWQGVAPLVGTAAHEGLCRAVHDQALAAAARLPNPAGIGADDLRAAAAADGAPELVRDVCRLFQNLLPGLAVNVACFRAQVADS